MLLNLTDGMLGESLGIQVICTFNTDVRNIDKALMRKGRLIASYEFQELTLCKTAQLLKFLKSPNFSVKKSMTLGDIYCIKEIDYSKEKKNSIGFLIESSKEYS